MIKIKTEKIMKFTAVWNFNNSSWDCDLDLFFNLNSSFATHGTVARSNVSDGDSFT
jgi:hypothetical protein